MKMGTLSKFVCTSAACRLSFLAAKSVIAHSVRHGGGGARSMVIKDSRYQSHVVRDLLHLYTCFFGGGCLLVIGLANFFVGPATLSDIPDGYVPKKEEYFRSPITRFFARYLIWDEQAEYEVHLHNLYAQVRHAERNIAISNIRQVIHEQGHGKGHLDKSYVQRKYIELNEKDYREVRELKRM